MNTPAPSTFETYIAKPFRDHGTKLIGFAQGTIAAVAGVTGIIPEHHLKYYLGVSAVLTFWRGFINSNNNS